MKQKPIHVAGIIPIAGKPLEFNFPWHDSLLPIHADYHAVERAIHTAALAGCNTIWLLLHRESQPILRRKIGEWVYDPKYVWVNQESSFFHKREVPIYYVPIKAKHRGRRDSQAWSSLHGAETAKYTCSKLSKWAAPTKYFVVSPYGVIDDDTARACRDRLQSSENIYIANGTANFKNDNHLPFSFTEDELKTCITWNREIYEYDDSRRPWSEVMQPIDLSKYSRVDAKWAYNISDWAGYRQFMSSEHNMECERPKYLVSHKWHGLTKIKTTYSKEE
jgi:hypothetical protein